jgi:hypothetical protein
VVADAKGLLAYALTFAGLVDLEEGQRSRARERAAEALVCASAVGRDSQVALAHAIHAEAARVLGDGVLAIRHAVEARRAVKGPLRVSARTRALVATL